MYHVNTAGDVKPCRATVKCPFGGESGKDNHFTDAAAARSFVEASFKQETLASLKKAPTIIKLNSNFGEISVINGDLSDASARLSLVSGLCGNLALDIHDRSGADIYFISFNGNATEETLAQDFESNPDSVFQAAHVMVASPTKPDAFVDAYGHRTIDDIEDVYEDALIVKGNRAMAEHFAGKDRLDLSEFAKTALELDLKQEGYSYEDFSFDDFED